jgi:hypothetical protein
VATPWSWRQVLTHQAGQPRLLRDRGKIAKGGIGGPAAWWSLKYHHACAYLTRRLADHSRAAAIAIATALRDDLAVVSED